MYVAIIWTLCMQVATLENSMNTSWHFFVRLSPCFSITKGMTNCYHIVWKLPKITQELYIK